MRIRFMLEIIHYSKENTDKEQKRMHVEHHPFNHILEVRLRKTYLFLVVIIDFP